VSSLVTLIKLTGTNSEFSIVTFADRAAWRRWLRTNHKPTCIFVHQFNEKTAEAVTAVDPNVSVEMVNMWEKPEEARSRGLIQGCVYINGNPLRHSIFEGEEFKNEARTLLKGKHKVHPQNLK